jgi:hypothetical protein
VWRDGQRHDKSARPCSDGYVTAKYAARNRVRPLDKRDRSSGRWFLKREAAPGVAPGAAFSFVRLLDNGRAFLAFEHLTDFLSKLVRDASFLAIVELPHAEIYFVQ